MTYATYSSGTLGQREAKAVLATVQSLRDANEINEDGEISEYAIVVRHLHNVMADQDLPCTATSCFRLVGNVYADVQDAHTRKLAAQHLTEAIAFDTNSGEF